MTSRVVQTEALLTPAEVAALFRVDPKTVTRWANTGELTSLRTPVVTAATASPRSANCWAGQVSPPDAPSAPTARAPGVLRQGAESAP